MFNGKFAIIDSDIPTDTEITDKSTIRLFASDSIVRKVNYVVSRFVAILIDISILQNLYIYVHSFTCSVPEHTREPTEVHVMTIHLYRIENALEMQRKILQS